MAPDAWEERPTVEELKARLLPPGTRLKDVPPDYRGLSWSEYMEVERAEERIRLESDRGAAPVPEQETEFFGKPANSDRDNYSLDFVTEPDWASDATQKALGDK